MLLTVVGLGANIANALLLAHRRGSSPIAGIPRDQAQLVPGGVVEHKLPR